MIKLLNCVHSKLFVRLIATFILVISLITCYPTDNPTLDDKNKTTTAQNTFPYEENQGDYYGLNATKSSTDSPIKGTIYVKMAPPIFPLRSISSNESAIGALLLDDTNPKDTNQTIEQGNGKRSTNSDTRNSTEEDDVHYPDQRAYIVESFLNDLPNYQFQINPVVRRYNDSAYKVALIGTVIRKSGDSIPFELPPIEVPEAADLINSLANATDSSFLRTVGCNKSNEDLNEPIGTIPAPGYNSLSNQPNQTENTLYPTNDINSMNLTKVSLLNSTSHDEPTSPSKFITSSLPVRSTTAVSETIELITSTNAPSIELRNSNQSETTTEPKESDQILASSIINSQTTTPISPSISSSQTTSIVSTYATSTPLSSSTSTPPSSSTSTPPSSSTSTPLSSSTSTPLSSSTSTTIQPSNLVTKKIIPKNESESLIDKADKPEFRSIESLKPVPETKWEPEGIRYGPEYFMLPLSNSQRYNYNENDISRDTRNNQMRPQPVKPFDQPIIRQNEIPHFQSNQRQVYDPSNQVSVPKDNYNVLLPSPPPQASLPAQPSLGRQDINNQRKAYNIPNRVPLPNIDYNKRLTPPSSMPPQQGYNLPNQGSIPLVDYIHQLPPPPPMRPSLGQKDYNDSNNNNNNVINTRKAIPYETRNPDINESLIKHNQFNVHNSAQRRIQNKLKPQYTPGQPIAIEEIVHSQGSRVNQRNRLTIQPELFVKIIRHYFANALTPEESRLTFERKAPLIPAKVPQSRSSPHLHNRNKFNT